MVKRVFSLNFLDAFIVGITTVAVPLLMLERKIDIATIGLVFALAPIAKLAIRTAAAVAADAIGERVFYSLTSLSNLAQSAAYALFQTPAGFAAGKAADGARESFIWAVNRSSIIAAHPEKGHFVLGSMVGGRFIYTAIGSLAVAMLYPVGGFELLFLLAGLLALIMLAVSFGVKNTPHQSGVKLSGLSPFGRRRSFYETASAMAVGGTLYFVTLYLLLPLYFTLAGFSLMEISLLYAAYFFAFGATLHFISHRSYGSGKAALFGSIIFIVSLCGLGFAPLPYVPFFFILMALGDAQHALLWEQIIYLEVKGSGKRATDIALLHMPNTLAVVLASGVSGFAAQQWGFGPIFLLAAITLAAYAAWALRLGAMRRLPTA